jgi:hypothetical protein
LRAGYKPAIRFYSYTPKTFGVGGGYSGPPIFVQGAYWWPGIEPMYLNQQVAEETRPEFLRLMENAARRGITAMRREGT